MNLTQRALAVLAVAFFLMMAFQTYQLVRDNSNLQNLRTSQTQPLEQAVQIRQQTEALAGDTAVLAEKGNIGAKLAVDEMAKQGLALHPPGTQPAGTAKP